jgi:uracil-DNA glycosylase
MSEQLHMQWESAASATDQLPEAWASLLSPKVREQTRELLTRIAQLRQTTTVYPPQGQIFHALEQTPPGKTRVVILGQDPYHGPGQAHGLAFSVPTGMKPPPSLRNIFKELRSDLHLPVQDHPTDLTPWTKQGVLLLNTTLTVEEKQAGSHTHLGWQQLTDALIQTASAHHPHIVFILWGNHAQQQRHLIDETRHMIIATAHPSPLSARRGFFGSRPFSQINTYLEKHCPPAIRW